MATPEALFGGRSGSDAEPRGAGGHLMLLLVLCLVLVISMLIYYCCSFSVACVYLLCGRRRAARPSPPCRPHRPASPRAAGRAPAGRLLDEDYTTLHHNITITITSTIAVTITIPISLPIPIPISIPRTIIITILHYTESDVSPTCSLYRRASSLRAPKRSSGHSSLDSTLAESTR